MAPSHPVQARVGRIVRHELLHEALRPLILRTYNVEAPMSRVLRVDRLVEFVRDRVGRSQSVGRGVADHAKRFVPYWAVGRGGGEPARYDYRSQGGHAAHLCACYAGVRRGGIGQ